MMGVVIVMVICAVLMSTCNGSDNPNNEIHERVFHNDIHEDKANNIKFKRDERSQLNKIVQPALNVIPKVKPINLRLDTVPKRRLSSPPVFVKPLVQLPKPINLQTVPNNNRQIVKNKEFNKTIPKQTGNIKENPRKLLHQSIYDARPSHQQFYEDYDDLIPTQYKLKVHKKKKPLVHSSPDHYDDIKQTKNKQTNSRHTATTATALQSAQKNNIHEHKVYENIHNPIVINGDKLNDDYDAIQGKLEPVLSQIKDRPHQTTPQETKVKPDQVHEANEKKQPNMIDDDISCYDHYDTPLIKNDPFRRPHVTKSQITYVTPMNDHKEPPQIVATYTESKRLPTSATKGQNKNEEDDSSLKPVIKETNNISVQINAAEKSGEHKAIENTYSNVNNIVITNQGYDEIRETKTGYTTDTANVDQEVINAISSYPYYNQYETYLNEPRNPKYEPYDYYKDVNLGGTSSIFQIIDIRPDNTDKIWRTWRNTEIRINRSKNNGNLNGDVENIADKNVVKMPYWSYQSVGNGYYGNQNTASCPYFMTSTNQCS